MLMSLGHRALVLAPVLVATTALSGCAGGGPDGGPAGTAGTVAVVASFYPLQYAAQRVGGDAVTVTNLTRPGAEPHDLELSPKDVAALSDADLVVYLSGFQPAVDDAVEAQAKGAGFDVGPTARLDLAAPGAEPAGQGSADGEHPGVDPHFWLDPTRLADVGDAIAERLGAAAPDRVATFTANAAALRNDLTALDTELRTGLASCTSKNLVTSHRAFGYLARRYGLTQVGITGLSPDAEPDAATVARVSGFVRRNGVRTIYYETLVSPAVAETVATEAGAKTAVLDPIEGISDASAARDYRGVMRANLASLRAGQPCP